MSTQRIYFDKFQQYIYNCWRDGKRTKDIVDGWHGVTSEQQVLETFKQVVERHFMLMKWDVAWKEAMKKGDKTHGLCVKDMLVWVSGT